VTAARPPALQPTAPANSASILGNPWSTSEPPAKIIVDPPLADSLAHGRVVIQYRAENLRIVQVFGPAALAMSPRIGHIHVTVDDAPWRWADASGEPLIINQLPVGRTRS
jgi:hypothetical protein